MIEKQRECVYMYALMISAYEHNRRIGIRIASNEREKRLPTSSSHHANL